MVQSNGSTLHLNKHLNVSFGYMKVFNDGGYFKIMDNLDCLTKFVANVDKSHIFCERNVTNYYDGEYNFTLWPREPNSPAMSIYNEYGICNGITISKMTSDFTELYWFTPKETEIDGRKFFIRNKLLLLKFIHYFEANKEMLHIPGINATQDLFKFKQGFDINFPKSEYTQQESPSISKLLRSIDPKLIATKYHSKVELSPREFEVLSIIGSGYTTKLAALKLNISIKTALYYIERIKVKTGLHFKSDLIKLYEQHHPRI